jgi:hypothetical protein
MNISQLNASELAALLGAQNPNISNVLSAGYPRQQQMGGSNSPNVDMSAQNAVLTSLLKQQLQMQQMQQHQLQQQQLGDQQHAQLLQQLIALGGLPPTAPPPRVDNLLLLLQQQRQLQDLQAIGGGQGNPFSSLTGSAFGGNYESSQREALVLANFLQGQQASPPPPPAQHLPQQAALAALSAGEQNRSAAACENDPHSLPLPPDRRRKGRTGTFPQKLHQMLTDLERQDGGGDIASFLPHGRAFSIHKPRDFVKLIMPKYFRMSRFSSFQRQLNLYDFQRITEGPDKGAYYHELFVQGRPILSTMMKRNKIKGVNTPQNAKSSNDKDDEDGSQGDENED